MIPQHLLYNLNLSSIAATPAIAADGTLKPGPSICYCQALLRVRSAMLCLGV
jgi:hypothetical protein